MIGPRGKHHQLSLIQNPSCSMCSLCQSSINVCVMGRGNVMAPIVLVGEAPGEAEGRTGQPFMGRSGQYLNKILQSLGMSDMVYITNIAKCRPPKNRTPKPVEAKLCVTTYLEPELTVVNPRVVVCLGNTATKHLPTRLTPVRGRLIQGEYFAIMSTWHPSYCLKVRTTKSDWATDELRQSLIEVKQFVETR